MIVIVSILTVVVAGNLASTSARPRAVYDELLSQVQYARKAAIAQRRPICVRISASDSLLCYSAAGTCSGPDAVASPTGGAPFRVAIPAGVSVGPPPPLTVEFNPAGGYVAAAPLAVSVSGGDATLSFTVEHQTGYAR